MGLLGLILVGVGSLVSFVAAIWILVLAFKQSIVWGLCSLFIPFVILVFVIKFWSVAKKPFLIDLGGVALIILGAVLGGGAGHSLPGQ